jgi:hypothetical protein
MIFRMDEKNTDGISEMEQDVVNTENDIEAEVVKEVELSDLDLMLQSVGEELKTVVREPAGNGDIKNKNTETGNRTIDTPGGLWTKGVGRRKRCRHSTSNNQNKSNNNYVCDENCDQDVKNENQLMMKNELDTDKEINRNINDDKNDKDRNEVLKKMKNGLLDPSRSLPEISKNILSNTNESENGETISSELKLRRLLRLILLADDSRLNDKKEKEKSFESVKLNSDNTKIIFRSSGNNGFEAFCYIVWGKKSEIGKGDNSQNNGNDDKNAKDNGKVTEIGIEKEGESHSAVVQCDNDGFKSTVIQALQSII